MCRILILFLMMIVSGCVSLGSKVAFMPHSNSEWKYFKHYSGNEYFFACGKARISINEIVISSKTYATGIIIPIPILNHQHIFENNPLIVVGDIRAVTDIDITRFVVTIQPLGVEVKAEKSDYKGVPPRFAYTSNKKISEIDYLKLHFNFPIRECESIPDLYLTKQTLSNNEFILAPGP